MTVFRRLFLLAAWCHLALIGALHGCRSTDHSEHAPSLPAASALTDAESKAADAASPRPAPAFDCKQQPDRSCCEALTPSCNDCRDQRLRERSAWQNYCVKPGVESGDCAGSPPVSECCAEATAECRDCRAAALTKMLAWKEACSDLEQLPCDRKPGLSLCCASLMPNYSQCRDRNLRLMDAWTQRCSKK